MVLCIQILSLAMQHFKSYEEEFLLIKLHLWLPSWQINFVFFFIFFFAYDFGILGYITVKNRYKNPVCKLFLVPISGFYGILSIKKYKIGIRSKCPGTDFTILSIQLIPNNGNFNACHFLRKKKIGNIITTKIVHRSWDTISCTINLHILYYPWPCNSPKSYEEEFLLIKLHLWQP